MANELKLHRAAIGRFLKSQPVGDATAKIGERVGNAARSNAAAVTKPREDKPEVEVKTFVGRDRARTHVAMTNPTAIRAEMVHRALTRAKPAGRQ